jgi:hypothetical protein
MEPEKTVPADRRLRTLTVLAAVLVTALGVAVLIIFRAELQELRNPAEDRQEAAVEKAVLWTTALAWTGGLSLVGMGAYFWWLGRRINRAGCFPPPGVKVICPMRIRTGAKARMVANVAELAALVCIVAGTIGMWCLYQRAMALLQP